MAKNFNSSALPEHCYAVLPGSGQLIEVRRGEKGYYPCAYSTSDREYNKVLANYLNAHEGISKAQAAAMLAGAVSGCSNSQQGGEVSADSGASAQSEGSSQAEGFTDSNDFKRIRQAL